MGRFNVCYRRGFGMKELVKEKIKTGNVLLIAPMGWGKTTLAAELAKELSQQGWRVGYIAPTLTLIDKKWEQLWSRLDSVIATAGAGQLCARGHKYYPQRYCRMCPLRRAAAVEPPPRLHYSELKNLTPEDACPYWTQEALLDRYRVVLGHYGRVRRLGRLDLLIIDEIHEYVVPELRQFDLSLVKERYDVSFNSVEELRDIIDMLLLQHDDDDLLMLYDVLRMPITWIEDDVLYGAALRELPQGVRILGLTATPPPGWPPPGWEMIEVKQEKRFAYIYDKYEWRYDELDTVDASYHLSEVLSRVSQICVNCKIALFATTSRRQLVSETLRQRYNIDVFDAWGKFRLGVDLLDYDVAVVLWPSLHVTVRRYLRARGVSPDVAELINAVQLSGRIRPDENKIVVFAGARFLRYRDYLERFYELRPL